MAAEFQAAEQDVRVASHLIKLLWSDPTRGTHVMWVTQSQSRYSCQKWDSTGLNIQPTVGA